MSLTYVANAHIRKGKSPIKDMFDFSLLGILCSAEELNCSDDNGRARLSVGTTQMSTKKLSKAIVKE